MYGTFSELLGSSPAINRSQRLQLSLLSTRSRLCGTSQRRKRSRDHDQSYEYNGGIRNQSQRRQRCRPSFLRFPQSISCLVEFLLRRDEGTGEDTGIRLGCDPQEGTAGRIQETLEVQGRPTTARSTSGPIYRRTEGTARNLTDDQIKQIKAANGGLS